MEILTTIGTKELDVRQTRNEAILPKIDNC